VRFKDLLGRKPESEVTTGRLITTPDAPDASASARSHSGERRRDLDDQPSARLRRSADASAEAEAASGRGVGPVAPSSLADAFARLLAAEQGDAGALVATRLPAPSLPARLSDADIERLSARIAARLIEGPVGDEVRRIVADVAARLVREEIARIREAVETPQP
jgi:hypothetical protein